MASIYRSLVSDHIRLLQFLDDTGLNCTLEEYALQNAPDYACLSYSWSSDGEGDYQLREPTMAINGESMPIRDNLYHALKHVGRIVRADGFWFWVDAVCINQQDLEERAEQVKLMKRLYEGAKVVFSWIGLTADVIRTQLAIRLMETLVEIPIEVLTGNKQRATLEWCQEYLQAQPSFRNGPTEDVLNAWEQMIHILKRRYWTRTWVHQEVTLPTAKFFCGAHSFSWSHLVAITKFHATYGGRRDIPDRFHLIFAQGRSVASPFLDLLNAYTNRVEVLSDRRTAMARLSAVIRDLRLTACADARDKIFAALPHATDLDMGTRHEEKLLTVDYFKDIVDVYVDLASYELANGRGLEILGFICAGTDNANYESHSLPSWVPDWTIPSRIRPLNSTGLLHGDYNILYEPCPGTKPDLSVAGNTLSIKGFVFDTIKVITPTSGRDEDATSNPGLRSHWSEHICSTTPNFSEEAFNKTLVADSRHITTEQNLDINVRGGYVDWDLIDQAPENLDKQRLLERAHLLDVIRCLCRDRRAGSTERGLLALLPEHAVAGDKIAALHGGNALYVVSPIDEDEMRYRFMGECYVHEMMDGQVLDLAAKDGIPTTTLMLV